MSSGSCRDAPARVIHHRHDEIQARFTTGEQLTFTYEAGNEPSLSGILRPKDVSDPSRPAFLGAGERVRVPAENFRNLVSVSLVSIQRRGPAPASPGSQIGPALG
jgi:hypothetical protein